MFKPVAVAAQRNAFIDFFLDTAPGVSVIDHT
jgi:hypothetical protein